MPQTLLRLKLWEFNLHFGIFYLKVFEILEFRPGLEVGSPIELEDFEDPLYLALGVE